LQPLTGIEKLKVLPAPDDAETLAELGEPGGIGRLMDALSDMAEVVIVDTSPVAATNRNNIDAVAVAGAAKKVALVALADVNQPSEVRAAADALLLSGAALAGVVLNLQFAPTRRQLLSELADFLGPLGGSLRKASVGARLD
jgi:Mrp family chromosome partitioning ATPase